MAPLHGGPLVGHADDEGPAWTATGRSTTPARPAGSSRCRPGNRPLDGPPDTCPRSCLSRPAVRAPRPRLVATDGAGDGPESRACPARPRQAAPGWPSRWTLMSSSTATCKCLPTSRAGNIRPAAAPRPAAPAPRCARPGAGAGTRRIARGAGRTPAAAGGPANPASCQRCVKHVHVRVRATRSRPTRSVTCHETAGIRTLEPGGHGHVEQRVADHAVVEEKKAVRLRHAVLPARLHVAAGKGRGVHGLAALGLDSGVR